MISSSLTQLFCLCIALQSPESTPFVTGKHLQLVRTSFTERDGLPSTQVRAIAVDRNHVGWAVAGEMLMRFDCTRWREVPEPKLVSSLFAPASGPLLCAGAVDGVWVLTDDRWRRAEESPADVISFSSDTQGTIWALAPSGIWRLSERWQRVHELHPTRMPQPRCLLPTRTGDVLVATETGLFALTGKRKYWMDFEVKPGGLASRKIRGLIPLDADHMAIATDQGLQITDGSNGWRTIGGADGLPVLDLKCLAAAPDGTVWIGTDEGLIRWSAGRFTYLAGKRWLPHDSVTALATDKNGSLWAATPGGISHIESRPLTLSDKAEIFQKTAADRERRHGFVTIMHLAAPGELAGARQEISDNDGLWTSMYIAAQSFRYAATKSPDAHGQASQAMQALLRLESITGIDGFPARALVHVDEPEFAAASLRSHPEWHPSPTEKNVYWKGDTSSDELDGHYFGWYVYSQLAANDQEKSLVRQTCKRVTDHILDHGYYLIDLDGKPTTWGVWAPEKLNDDPKWYRGRGLNSLEILSHLKVASYLVGDPRYEEAYHDLIHKHHYAINAIDAKTTVSHDDQLAFLSYYPLLQLEQDPGLRSIYLTSLERTWQPERIESNPLWNFIYGASTGKACDVEAAVETLREIPLELVTWRVRNSHRADLKFDPVMEQRGIRQLLRPLRWSERAIHKWDANPFMPDGGNDQGEGDPTIWLLPYWMGRYHRFIEE